MEIRFVAEWMGNKPGGIRNLKDSVAKTLLERGTVEFVDKPETPLRSLTKRVKKPKKNKMVKRAKNK